MNQTYLKVGLEAIWWVFTAVAVIAILAPVYLWTHDYPFYISNALFIVITITFARYAFFLRHTFLARLFWPKFLIIALSAILVFVLITALGDFTNYLEERGLQTLVDHLHIERQYKTMSYIQGEVIFFGIASIISSALLALRMLISIWRMYNRGTV